MSLGYIDVAKFESEHQNLELIEKFGQGEREIAIFLNKDDGKYYCKGAFARWDAICYIQLNTITDREALQGWIEKMKIQNK